MIKNNIKTNQFHITVPAGKRLIAKAVISLEQIKTALENNTIVIIAGSTNGYVAEELLLHIEQIEDFSRNTFFRGITPGPGKKIDTTGTYFNTDVVIEKGKWSKGKTIFDVAESLGKRDIIIKGANAIDSERMLASIQVRTPSLGPSGPMMQAIIGKRSELIIPVGLEKRIFGNIAQVVSKVNSPSTTNGMKMIPVSGTIITELESIEMLTGASAELVAGGGIFGGEGGSWLAITGTDEQLYTAKNIINSVVNEPPFGY
ncbi:hypothetical protein CFB3_26100 [Clostridium folliculivorans]|nr:hypothetical protein CFB3_26100 [Clostridium folliculivorans]